MKIARKVFLKKTLTSLQILKKQKEKCVNRCKAMEKKTKSLEKHSHNID